MFARILWIGKKKSPPLCLLSKGRSFRDNPTYNRPEMLEHAIKSVISQSYKDFEVIVVNDAGANVSHIISAIGDPRVKCVKHEKNRGLAAARNTGINAARGEYIASLMMTISITPITFRLL